MTTTRLSSCHGSLIVSFGDDGDKLKILVVMRMTPTKESTLLSLLMVMEMVMMVMEGEYVAFLHYQVFQFRCEV